MADELISISTFQFERSMAAYTLAVGKSMREALYEEWPLLIRKVMDFTPPFQTGGAKGGTDQAIGRAAVASDIRKTMRPFNPYPIRDPKLKGIVESKDLAEFNKYAGYMKGGPMRNMRAVAFSPQVHTSQRNARGRVPKGLGNVVLGTDSDALKAYVKRTQDKVGIAKSGWWPALALVGGEAPGFVTKHGTGNGTFRDNHADEIDPSITAINRTPWAGRRDEGQRIIQAAIASRAVAIASKTRTKLRLAARAARLAA